MKILVLYKYICVRESSCVRLYVCYLVICMSLQHNFFFEYHCKPIKISRGVFKKFENDVSERAAMSRDAAAELDRMTRTKKPMPGSQAPSNTSAS